MESKRCDDVYWVSTPMGFVGDSPTERVWRTKVVPEKPEWYTKKMEVDKMADIQSHEPVGWQADQQQTQETSSPKNC